FAALNLTAGYLSIGTGNTLNISTGGLITGNGGDFASGTAGGTINFNGSGTFTTNTSLNPYNVYVSGAVNFDASTNINGTFRINNGGSVNTNPPSYATGSTLQYNTTGTYGRYLEWSNTTGAGYPYNVQVSNNTTLNYPNGVNAARAMEGSLTIDAGSSFYMDYGSPGLTNPLSVGRNISIDGNLSLGDAIGGDLNVGGNWTQASGVTPNFNNRAVFFNGAGTQTITNNSGTQTFAYLGINKTSGNLTLSSSIATSINLATTSGDVLQLLGTAGGIDLNGQTITMSAAGGNILTNGSAHTITGSSGSAFIFNYNGTKTIRSSSGGTLIFDNNVLVKINGASLAGVDFGNGLTTINGTLQMNTGSYVLGNAPTYATGSLLQYNSGSNPYNRTVEWGTTSGAGYPYNVQISNNTVLVPGGSTNTAIALNAANNLTIDAGASFYMDYGSVDMTIPLTVGKDLVINGNLSESDILGGDIIVKGDWLNNTGSSFSPKNRAVYFSGTTAQSIGGTNTTSFDYLLNSNVSADVTMNKNVTVNQKLTLQTGSILAINGNTLTLNETVDNTSGNAGTIRGSSTSNLTIGGSSTGSVGTLNFTPGSQTLNTLTMNRTGVTGTAALLGTNNNLTVSTLTLNNGILTTGNNLLSVTGTNGSAASVKAWAANTDSVSLRTSFVALCDGSGVPITTTDGSKGLRVNNLGTTEVFLPIGYNYSTSPNRLSLSNNGTSDNYTVTLFKGDIGGTPLPRVNRIWHITEGTAGGSNVSMKLYFLKRPLTGYGTAQEEVEDGFIYNDGRLLHRIGAYPTYGFANTSGGGTNGANDVPNFILSTGTNTEVYAAYTFGNSGDNTNAQTANGITDFTGLANFSVANTAAIILPVSIVNVKAYRQFNTVKVEWTALTETNVSFYEIQRSSNATEFKTTGTQQATGNGALQQQYGFIDVQPLQGFNYYRIKAIDKDGKITYSAIVPVNISDAGEDITVYPNPVKGKRATILFNNMQPGNYILLLYNMAGKKLLQKTIVHAGGSASYRLALPQSFAGGIYHLTIFSNKIKIEKNLLAE
ncbi:MAG TPA: hypothetical protein PLA68_07655, partial [Panacibacter sp.]|nr:hypothetical protein [Panacibacter sp.]